MAPDIPGLVMDVETADTFAALHEDMLTLLDRVIDQLESAISDNSVIETDGRSYLKLLRDERVAAERLELRMPIIAPMKAGKSTLISAIVGTDIMPARALAMTSLPTQIVPLKENGFRLTLPYETYDYFARLKTQLFKKLSGADLSALQSQYPQLAELMQRLVDGGIDIAARVDGHKPAQQALTELNDLVRIASVVGLADDVAGELPSPPVLTTPLLGPGAVSGSSDRGVLTIIDTPGPDEYGLAARLTQTVTAELARSHVVLMVLDFTHMGTEADAKMRELAKPILGTLGTDKLYVVVNKIDARTGNDTMDTSQVVQFAAHLLGIPMERASERVFETSAARGLAASQVLAAIDAGVTEEQVPEHPAFVFFADQLKASDRYRRMLFAGTISDWREEAEELWSKSGLPRLLDQAVGDLRAHAAPTVLSSVRTKLDAVVTGLTDSARLRIRAGAADRTKVEKELSGLKRELQKLGLQRASVKKPDQLLKDLDRHLAGKVRACEAEADKLIEGIGDNLDGDAGRGEGLRARIERMLRGRLKRDGEVYEYADADEAQDAIDKITGATTEELRSLLDTARNGIVNASAEWTHQQMAVQEKAVRGILEAATKRLSATFDLDLRLPAPEFEAKAVRATVDADFEDQLVWRTRIDEREVRLARYLWFKKGIKKKEVSYSTTERTYLVSIPTVRAAVSDSFREALGYLKEEMHQYVSIEVTAQIDDYYQRMDNFLSQYQRSLEQSQLDWRAGDQERERITGRLTSLVHTMDGHRTTLAELSNRLQSEARR
ncbi:dynamin family protein [Dactylosporangium sp. AC04546]|uniref:dynamin family protein n=1 Tax=Dactylosporangium sp. AC04546 TaxID=2862460 RepID=UPI001EE0474F|nr:dynamin family protein [Dactylosporangium sp. AC04546]WVK87007.1 dynamin family protein [Dactylosporangium sp. AC04546]